MAVASHACHVGRMQFGLELTPWRASARHLALRGIHCDGCEMADGRGYSRGRCMFYEVNDAFSATVL